MVEIPIEEEPNDTAENTLAEDGPDEDKGESAKLVSCPVNKIVPDTTAKRDDASKTLIVSKINETPKTAKDLKYL